MKLSISPIAIAMVILTMMVINGAYGQTYSGPVTSNTYSSTTRQQINNSLVHLGCTEGGVCTPGGTGSGMVDPTTTRGDLIYRSASGTTRLALGSNGQCLISNGVDALWGACPGGGTGTGTVTTMTGTTDPTGSIPCTAPTSTNLVYYTDTTHNNIYYCSATNTWRLMFTGVATDPVEVTGLAQSPLPAPSSGSVSCYFDSTALTWQCINSSGAIYTSVKISTSRIANQFVTHIPSSGIPATAQPTDADLSTSDITTNNVSITKHGFVPKAPNDLTKALCGDGNWGTTCGGTGGGSGSGILTMTLGTGPPATACTAPSSTNLAQYTNTTNNDIYVCTATNIWELMFMGGPADPVEVTGLSQTALPTPSSGMVSCYFDSTASTWQCKNSAGAIYTTVKIASSRTANQFATYIDPNGILQLSPIVPADLPTAGLNGVLKYTSGTPSAIGTSPTNCVHEDGSSGPCSSGGGSGGVGSTSGSLTFTSLPDGVCNDGTLTLTGVTTGTPLATALPSTLPAGIITTAFVSATNTITIRSCNLSGLPQTYTATYGARIANYYLSTTAAPTFSSTLDGACSSQPITLTGAVIGDPVVIGPPSTLATGLSATGIVTAADTVNIQVCNLGGGTITPSGTWTVQIAK